MPGAATGIKYRSDSRRGALAPGAIAVVSTIPILLALRKTIDARLARPRPVPLAQTLLLHLIYIARTDAVLYMFIRYGMRWETPMHQATHATAESTTNEILWVRRARLTFMASPEHSAGVAHTLAQQRVGVSIK